MTRLVQLFALCAIALFPSIAQADAAAAGATSSGITWITNFDDAQTQAQKTGKPLLLFFTGSDWCGWCHKLTNEVLSTAEFKERVKDQFVFVELDFPRRKTLPADLTAQNAELSQRFGVRGFPTIIVLDPAGRRITVTGYRAGGGQAYAEELIKEVADYKALKANVDNLEGANQSSEELEQLFSEAKRRGRDDYQDAILTKGLKTADNGFFLLEKYRRLAEQDLDESAEAQTLRAQILESATEENKADTEYRLAVIDFQGRADKLMPNDAPSRAVAPLLTYLKAYDHLNLDNEWKVHMTISQVMADKGRLQDALDYSKRAAATAPSEFQSDINSIVGQMERQMMEELETPAAE